AHHRLNPAHQAPGLERSRNPPPACASCSVEPGFMLDSGPRVELAESPASDGLPGVFRVTPSRYPQSMIESERARRWASTMEGHPTVSDIRLAHAGPGVATGAVEPLSRAERA